jgi:precorrin-2 methylase
MLYLVGLGLADEKDVTVRGLEIIKKAERVYLESYTAVLLVDKEVLVRPSPVSTALEKTADHAAVGVVLWALSNHCGPRNGRVR